MSTTTNARHAIDALAGIFPGLQVTSPEVFETLTGATEIVRLSCGDVAYKQGADCPNYLICLEGQTRVFKNSETGREVLIYKVNAGKTCVFTTHCLLTNSTFPAESVAETDVRLAAVPAAVFQKLMQNSELFRQFVLADYSQLLGSMLTLVEDVVFTTIEQRLAGRLLVEADKNGVVAKTHLQLALDLGSVREVVSRHLSTWERAGWVATGRGEIVLLDRPALVRQQGSPTHAS